MGNQPSLASSLADSLILFAALVCVLDFLLGKKGHQRIQAWLEEAWIKWDDIRYLRFGLAEASGCKKFLENTFGDNLLSLRRVLSCTILVTTSTLIVKLIRAQYISKMTQMPLRLYFEHWTQEVFDIVIQSFFGMISISLTIIIIDLTVRFCNNIKYGTILFGLSLVSTTVLSLTLLLHIATEICVDLSLMIWSGKDIIYAFGMFKSRIHHAFSFDKYKADLLNPITLYDALLQDDVIYAVTHANGMVFSVIRLGFAVTFVFWWVIFLPMHRFASHLMLRLAETEKGALTLVAASIAATAKLVEKLTKYLSS